MNFDENLKSSTQESLQEDFVHEDLKGTETPIVMSKRNKISEEKVEVILQEFYDGRLQK